MKTVILSDNEPCEVRQLGLFELDNKAPEVMGAYRYTLILATGQVQEDDYDIYAWAEPPKKPTGDIQPSTPEWEQLKEYETYQAALAHEKERLKSFEERIEAIKSYILQTCISDENLQRIVEPEDWQKVYNAALIPQIKEEDIAHCLRETFQGFIWDVGNFTGIIESKGGVGESVGGEIVGDGDN